MRDVLFEELMAAITPKDELESHIGVIAMGGSGTGKTTLIGTSDHPLILNFDKGLTTLETMGLIERVDYFPLNFTKCSYVEKKIGADLVLVEKPNKNIEKVQQTLAYASNRTGPFAKDGPLKDVHTIALDGWTSMSSMFLYEIKASLGLSTTSVKASFDGYGQLLMVLQDIADKLQECKENYDIITTVLPKQVQKPGTSGEGDKIIVPDIDGSFRDRLGRVLDEFYYLDVKIKGSNKTYMVYTQPLYSVPGLKSRAKLEAELENVEFTKIQKAYEDSFQKCREEKIAKGIIKVV